MNEFLVIPAASWLERPFQKTAKPSALGGKPHLSAREGPGTGKSGVQCPHGAVEYVCSGASVPETRAFVLLIVSRVLKAAIFLDLSHSWWENCLISLLAPGRGITRRGKTQNPNSIPMALWASVSLPRIWESESPPHGTAVRLKGSGRLWELKVTFFFF